MSIPKTDISEDRSMQINMTMETILKYLEYYPFLLTVLGSLGNVMSVLIFFGTKLRKQSSSYYLSSLAINDTIFLIIQLVPQLSKIDWGVYQMEGFCQFFTYLTQLSSFISVWLIVIFTSERFIAVRYPLHRSVVCTVHRAKIVVSILIIFAFITHVPYLMITSPVEKLYTENSTITTITVCDVKESCTEINIWLNNADLLINMVIPFFLIVIFNCMICRSVCRLARIRRTMTLRTSQRKYSTPQNAQHKSQIKVTKMLLVVSTVFLCLNLPSYLFRLHNVFYKSEHEIPEDYANLQIIANQMFNTNFGINFILYCVSGQNFRRALIEFWNKRRHYNRRLKDTQVTTVLSEFSKSGIGSKQTTVNGTWKEVHELIPIAHS